MNSFLAIWSTAILCCAMLPGPAQAQRNNNQSVYRAPPPPVYRPPPPPATYERGSARNTYPGAAANNRGGVNRGGYDNRGTGNLGGYKPGSIARPSPTLQSRPGASAGTRLGKPGVSLGTDNRWKASRFADAPATSAAGKGLNERGRLDVSRRAAGGSPPKCTHGDRSMRCQFQCNADPRSCDNGKPPDDRQDGTLAEKLSPELKPPWKFNTP